MSQDNGGDDDGGGGGGGGGSGGDDNGMFKQTRFERSPCNFCILWAVVLPKFSGKRSLQE